MLPASPCLVAASTPASLHFSSCGNQIQYGFLCHPWLWSKTTTPWKIHVEPEIAPLDKDICLHIIKIVSSNLWTPYLFSGLYDVKHLQLVNHEQSQFQPQHYRCICKRWKTYGVSVKVFPVYIMKHICDWSIVNTSTIFKNRKSPQLR